MNGLVTGIIGGHPTGAIPSQAAQGCAEGVETRQTARTAMNCPRNPGTARAVKI